MTSFSSRSISFDGNPGKVTGLVEFRDISSEFRFSGGCFFEWNPNFFSRSEGRDAIRFPGNLNFGTQLSGTDYGLMRCRWFSSCRKLKSSDSSTSRDCSLRPDIWEAVKKSLRQMKIRFVKLYTEWMRSFFLESDSRASSLCITLKKFHTWK